MNKDQIDQQLGNQRAGEIFARAGIATPTLRLLHRMLHRPLVHQASPLLTIGLVGRRRFSALAVGIPTSSLSTLARQEHQPPSCIRMYIEVTFNLSVMSLSTAERENCSGP